MLRTVLMGLLVVVTSSDGAHAQRRQVSLEATLFHATIGYGWMSPGRVIGIEAGVGSPEFDRLRLTGGWITAHGGSGGTDGEVVVNLRPAVMLDYAL